MENENKLPPDFKAKWIAALRSGEYKQGRGQLYDINNNTYCCVGVYAKCNGMNLTKNGMDFLESADSGLYYMPLQKHIGINLVRKLVEMNDSGVKSFIEIADFIEANL